MNADTAKLLTEYIARVGSANEYKMLEEVNKSLRDVFKDCQDFDSNK